MKSLTTTLVLIFLASGTTVTAQDGFRVDTAVYQKGVSKPIGRSTTYFTQSLICDVSGHAEPQKSSALLIDRSTDTATIVGHPPVDDGNRHAPTANSQVACRISYDELLRTASAISTRVENKPAIVQFAAAPKFNVQWSEKGDRLSMAAQPMRYVVKTKLAKGRGIQVASDYREFADWSARASATRRFGLPPNARLELNDELARKGHIPTRVEMTKKTVSGEITHFSTHEFKWQLSAEDQEQIDFWLERVASLANVDLVTLRHGRLVAGQKPAGGNLK